MDTNITKRAIPLPYPATPCAESWRAAHAAPQEPSATPPEKDAQ